MKVTFYFFHELIADDPVEVEAIITPGCLGTREDGFQVEPDEPPSAELIHVFMDGKTVSVESLALPKSVLSEMEEAALEAADEYEYSEF